MYQGSRKHLSSLAFFGLMVTGANSLAQAIEEPHYTLLQSFDNVEIRSYDPVIQAVVSLPDSKHSSQGFRRLAAFIFGGNNAGQTIAMTAPVQETQFVDQPEMAFTMPAQYTLDSLPKPDDQRIRLNELPQRTVAVVAFSGWATANKVKRYTQELQTTLADNELDVTSEVMLNQYNPPWTPPFKRRNEIMLEINWVAPNTEKAALVW